MAQEAFRKWALANITQVQGEHIIFAHDIWDRYSTFCDSAGENRLQNGQCGKVLSRLYPSIGIVSRRVGGKKLRAYAGITWREGESENGTAPSAGMAGTEWILNSTPDDFFLISKNESWVTLGVDTACTLNGTPVLKILTIRGTGDWEFTLFGKPISPEQLGLEAWKVQNVASLEMVSDAVLRARICKGFPYSPVKGDCLKPTCFLVEQWEFGGKEMEYRCRSRGCTVILTMCSRVDHCPNCRLCTYNHLIRKAPDVNRKQEDSVATDKTITDDVPETKLTTFSRVHPRI